MKTSTRRSVASRSRCRTGSEANSVGSSRKRCSTRARAPAGTSAAKPSSRWSKHTARGEKITRSSSGPSWCSSCGTASSWMARGAWPPTPRRWARPRSERSCSTRLKLAEQLRKPGCPPLVGVLLLDEHAARAPELLAEPGIADQLIQSLEPFILCSSEPTPLVRHHSPRHPYRTGDSRHPAREVLEHLVPALPARPGRVGHRHHPDVEVRELRMLALQRPCPVLDPGRLEVRPGPDEDELGTQSPRIQPLEDGQDLLQVRAGGHRPDPPDVYRVSLLMLARTLDRRIDARRDDLHPSSPSAGLGGEVRVARDHEPGPREIGTASRRLLLDPRESAMPRERSLNEQRVVEVVHVDARQRLNLRQWREEAEPMNKDEVVLVPSLDRPRRAARQGDPLWDEGRPPRADRRVLVFRQRGPVPQVDPVWRQVCDRRGETDPRPRSGARVRRLCGDDDPAPLRQFGLTASRPRISRQLADRHQASLVPPRRP